MDIATLFGILSGIAIIFAAIFIEKGTFTDFWSFGALMIVGGGTISATLIHSPIKKVVGVFKAAIKILFRTERWDPYIMVQELMKLVEKRRYQGIFSLEEDLKGIKDNFLRRGVELAIDEKDTDKIRNFLQMDLYNMARRHKAGHEIFQNMGTYAPGFGLVGTIIGLIMMMKGFSTFGGRAGGIESLEFDMTQLMVRLLSGMAVALLCTFYGVVLANLVFMPLAGKLRTRSEEEIFVKEIIIEGIVGIQTGEFPMDVQEKLESYFSPSKRSLLRNGKSEETKLRDVMKRK